MTHQWVIRLLRIEALALGASFMISIAWSFWSSGWAAGLRTLGASVVVVTALALYFLGLFLTRNLDCRE